MNNGSVNKNVPFDELCKEKHVNIASNNEDGIFNVDPDTGELERLPLTPYKGFSSITLEWEIQHDFHTHNNIVPHWSDNNGTWGLLDEETGLWTGAVGMVTKQSNIVIIHRRFWIKIERDEADYAIYGFACTYARSQVALCTNGIDYSPTYWLTREMIWYKILKTVDI